MSEQIQQCVFCLAGENLATVDYSPRKAPPEWPAEHCFLGKSLAKCEQCGGAFVRQLLSEAELDSFYSAVYSKQRPAGPGAAHEFHELNTRFLSQALYLKSFIELRDGMRILELGPNVVSALPALSLFCDPEYFYFDQVDSPIIAAYGGRRLGRYGNGASIVEALGAASIDLVYTSHSLEHVSPAELDELMHGVRTALKRGGHIFIEVPDDLSTGVVVFPHTLFFSRKSIEELLKRHGYQIVTLARWAAPSDPENAAQNTYRGGTGGATGPSRRTLKHKARDLILNAPVVGELARSLILQRGFLRALKRMPTPYDRSMPFFRVIARKEN